MLLKWIQVFKRILETDCSQKLRRIILKLRVTQPYDRPKVEFCKLIILKYAEPGGHDVYPKEHRRRAS